MFLAPRLLAVSLAFLGGPAIPSPTIQGPAAGGFSFEHLQGIARERAQSPFAPRETKDLPDWLQKLDYDGYRSLRFRPETYLWAADPLPFRLQFLHRGYLFLQKVPVWVVENSSIRELHFSPDQFDYGSRTERPPEGLGYSGFAVRSPIEAPDRWPEVASFQGASYFRLLGANEVYGACARGLAIDTAEPSGEEFPEFVEFWIEKPAAGARSLVAYALLDSRSVTGAYRFLITPGARTRAEVTACLYPRRNVTKLGLAPLTSMFLCGESRPVRVPEWRPEVHDSDGLLYAARDGAWVWRPLENSERSHRVTRFELEDPIGFGLIQRDRSFASYEDLESRFETRPSYWVTPRGAWGKGALELVELPSTAEWNENIVAYWVPEKRPSKDQEFRVEYDLTAFGEDAALPPLARATSSRIRQGKDGFLCVLDFAGAATNEKDGELRADVTTARGHVRNIVVQRNEPEACERCSFDVTDLGPEPLDVRVTLRQGDRPVSETVVLHRGGP